MVRKEPGDVRSTSSAIGRPASNVFLLVTNTAFFSKGFAEKQ
jgi:hypothetical protein